MNSIHVKVFLNQVLILLLMLSNTKTSAQTEEKVVVYKPVFINQCTGEKDSTYWFLFDTGNDYNQTNEYYDSVNLFELGKYMLRIPFLSYSIMKEFTTYGVVHDTFYTPSIKITLPISNPPSVIYYYCGSLATGKVTDYYYNEKKRAEGNFEKGAIIDTFIEYYPSGTISSLKVINTKHITYYENGQIMHYNDYLKKRLFEYYESGKLLSKQVFKHRYKKGLDYYESGFVKSSYLSKSKKSVRKDYYLNGKVQEIIKCKTRELEDNYRFQKCNLIYFNQSGKKSMSIKLHCSFTCFSYSLNSNLFKISDIKEVQFYQNGKSVKKIISQYQYEDKDKDMIKVYTLYEMKDRKWIELKKVDMLEIKTLIEEFKNK